MDRELLWGNHGRGDDSAGKGETEGQLRQRNWSKIAAELIFLVFHFTSIRCCVAGFETDFSLVYVYDFFHNNN